MLSIEKMLMRNVLVGHLGIFFGDRAIQILSGRLFLLLYSLHGLQDWSTQL